MSKYSGAIESLLLVAGKPLALSALAKLLSCEASEIRVALDELEHEYNTNSRGIQLMENDGKVQLTTNPAYKKVVADFIHDETTGELTKPSLEALTIIAYRQPITKEELEQIRGVNCSLILRNLMIRGLIDAQEHRGGLTRTYSVTMDFLRYLGIHKVEELPDFERLHMNEIVQEVLERAKEQAQTEHTGSV